MKITFDVSSCRECPYVTNSARLHDDAFTSAPLHTTWYCDFGKELEILDDEDVIDPKCPINKD
jgi:hypothetical protein